MNHPGRQVKNTMTIERLTTPEGLTAVAAVVTIVVAIVQLILRNPKLGLRSPGSSTSGGKLRMHTISVFNLPRIFGLRIKRHNANIQGARLVDPRTKFSVGSSLSWRKGPDQKFSPSVELEAGEHAKLHLFMGRPNENRYYPFNANAYENNTTDQLPSIEDDQRRYLLIITEVSGRRHKFRIRVTQSPGQLRFSFIEDAYSRWDHLLWAMPHLKAIFKVWS